MIPFIPAYAIALGLLLSMAQDADGASCPNGGAKGPGSAAFMERFDTDSDGQLSSEEKQAARDTLKAEGHGSRQQDQNREKAMEQFDVNGDGQLDETERAALKEQMKLRRFDADGDGQLSADESAKAEEFHQKMLARFDRDGDGKLNQKERKHARMAMQKRQQGGGQGGNGPRRGPPQGAGDALPFLNGTDDDA